MITSVLKSCHCWTCLRQWARIAYLSVTFTTW
jgi:hypothetical protein